MITIKTLSELITEVIADLEGAYGENIPLFGKVMIRAIAFTQAGKLKLYYLAIGKLQKNIFVDTAEPEASGGTLERFGRVKLNRNPFPAQAGQYDVQVSGDVGATIPAQRTFKSDDDSVNPGKLFILDSDFVLVTGSDTITLRALEAGEDSKMVIGETMTATAPIIGVDRGVTVTAESVEPFAAEEIETYRDKALVSYRTEPEGGAGSDYRAWAFDAQGVQQAYPYAKSGANNEINLYVEATIADSIDGKGTPSAGLLTDVEADVEMDPDTTMAILTRGRRPLGVFQVHYLPVTIQEVDIVIDGFMNLDADIETLLFDAIKEVLDFVRPYIASVDVLEDKNDIFSVNTIIAAILDARPGSVFGAVTLTVGGLSVSSYTFSDGNIPHLDAITYT